MALRAMSSAAKVGRHQAARGGEREVAAGTDGGYVVFGFQHVARAGDDKKIARRR